MAVRKFFRRYGKQDYLKMKFNPETKQYEFFYGIDLIPYKKLDREYKQIFKEKNNELKTNPNLIEEEFKKLEREKQSIERYNKLHSLGVMFNSSPVVSDVPTSPINEEFSKQLDTMFNEENILYGIHRTSFIDKKYLLDILEHGLPMTGHKLTVEQNEVELSRNVTYHPDNMDLKLELLNAHGYKQAKGSFLIRIPYENLEKKDLYIKYNEPWARLDPKFIVGYVPLIVDENKKITVDRIITLKDLQKEQINTITEEEVTQELNIEEVKHR